MKVLRLQKTRLEVDSAKCACPASGLRKVMQFTSEQNKMTVLLSTRIIQLDQIYPILLCNKDFPGLWEVFLALGKEIRPTAFAIVTFSPEGRTSYGPNSFLVSPRHWNASLVPFCCLAQSHLPISNWVLLPGSRARLLSWVDIAAFPQQLSWCVYNSLPHCSLCRADCSVSFIPSFPMWCLWGLMWQRRCSGVGLNFGLLETWACVSPSHFCDCVSPYN